MFSKKPPSGKHTYSVKNISRKSTMNTLKDKDMDNQKIKMLTNEVFEEKGWTRNENLVSPN